MAEIVDILLPPDFRKSGRTKPKKRAWKDGDWIGTFNLSIVQNQPVPSVVYQIRSPRASWMPNKLAVAAGGHYLAGEEIAEGLREVEEELGKKYQIDQLTRLGRRLYVGPDTKGRIRHNVVDIFMVIDNSALASYQLQKDEVYGLCACPIDKLIKAHTQKDYHFDVQGITNQGKEIQVQVSKDSFPYNWDNYHFKLVLTARRLLNKEDYLIY